jgi:hypothetical protein
MEGKEQVSKRTWRGHSVGEQGKILLLHLYKNQSLFANSW